MLLNVTRFIAILLIDGLDLLQRLLDAYNEWRCERVFLGMANAVTTRQPEDTYVW